MDADALRILNKISMMENNVRTHASGLAPLMLRLNKRHNPNLRTFPLNIPPVYSVVNDVMIWSGMKEDIPTMEIEAAVEEHIRAICKLRMKIKHLSKVCSKVCSDKSSEESSDTSA